MRLALLTEANPRVVNQSHPSFVSKGRYRVVADGAKSKLSVRRSTIDHSCSSDHAIGEEFDGLCIIIVLVVEAHPDDKRINVFAERLNV